VTLPSGEIATHLVITYNLDGERRFVGIDFIRLFHNTDDTEISAPSNGFFTFREELRILDKSSQTYEGSRDGERSIIESMLKQAYEKQAEISFQDVGPQ
jgi:hypothetical protein